MKKVIATLIMVVGLLAGGVSAAQAGTVHCQAYTPQCGFPNAPQPTPIDEPPTQHGQPSKGHCHKHKKHGHKKHSHKHHKH